MTRYPMTDVIASREYEFVTGERTVPIRVDIGRPSPNPDGPQGWYCPWTIERDGQSRSSFTVGMDSLQALMLALSGLRASLQRIASVGKLTSIGGLEGPFIDIIGADTHPPEIDQP